MERYRALADYALIGDGRTAALVTADGSLDWWCAPRFDSGAVFARLLDADRGGCFAVMPPERGSSQMAYEEGTNVLRHRFIASQGEAVLHDALAWPVPADAPGSVVVRLLEGVRGSLGCGVRFAPRPEFGTAPCPLEEVPGGVLATWPGGALRLLTPAPLRVVGDEAVGTFEVGEGETVPFVLSYARAPGAPGIPAERGALLLEQTRDAWRAWDARTRYEGPYRETVRRSSLVLRLLMYEPTGAMVAAPTTSLPERIGGVRNWDYRYTWVRDGAFVVDALLRVGHPRYTESFLRFLFEATRRTTPELRVLYAVDGGTDLTEQVLPHLEGYRRSAPVRVGNLAVEQHQLDIYGELLEGVGMWMGQEPRDERLRASLGKIVDTVAERWREPDQGFWEMRCEPRHFVLSKAMAWVALEWGLRLALPGDRERWAREREACRAETLQRGWSEELGAFQMAFDYPHLDAANLLLSLIGFIEPGDPRMVATVDRILHDLTAEGLVYRYLDADDGLPGGEAAFTYCTFWLVDNLALQGRLDEARTLFERAMSRASPLGLFAEEAHPTTGELLGNFPQALPHLGALKSAVLLQDLALRQVQPTRVVL